MSMADAASQTLKSDRRQIHEEKRKRSEKRKETNRRIRLAEELMRIFAINDECFNMTLRELNINKTWGKDSGDNGLTEYRQFYLDSLNSFGAMLAEDHDDENALAQAGLSSESAIAILGKFSEIGGSKDPQQYSKLYRSMATMLQEVARKNSVLSRKRRNHEQKLQELEVDGPLLKLMEAEQARAQDKRVESLGKKVSFAKELLPSLHGLAENNYSDELDRIEKELKSALNELSLVAGSKNEDKDFVKLKNKVDHAKAAAANMAEGIRRVELEISGLEWPMPRHEFESVTTDIMHLATVITPALAKFITHRHEDFDKFRELDAHTDLTKPHEWFPRARLDKRKIIFHAGPTNSGKTYTALQRLKQATSGMYLAPLRLLAAETYENLTAEGVYTDLLTGQEKREVPFSTHRSSTVELACLETDYDVVVIDEIQMLQDDYRGFAWTRALLGARCKEVHVCGGMEAIDIVKKICKMCGDDFELHTYKRFSNLKVLDNSLAKTPSSKGSYENVQPGDCVVAFSKDDIFAIKREIETSTQYKCCVIYGSLPPDVRAEQARRFNNPDSEYEVLVASDAIGMGLNLSIKRIIFNTMFKNNGERVVQLDHSSVKQIAGRAGRRNSPYPHGEVTCRDPNDMAHLRKCMSTEINPLKKAGLVPTPNHIEMFCQHLDKYGPSEKKIELHDTIRKFSVMATLKGDFFLCRKKSMEVKSYWLKDIDLSPAEKFTLCMSPVNEKCVKSRNMFLRYVETYMSGKVPGLHSSMRPRPAKSLGNLAELCTMHGQLELFLWLQTKLPSNVVEVIRAVTLKERTIEMINSGLYRSEHLSLNHDYIAKDLNVKKVWASENVDREELI